MIEYGRPYLNYGSELFWNFYIFFTVSSRSISVSDIKVIAFFIKICECIVTFLVFYMTEYGVDT